MSRSSLFQSSERVRGECRDRAGRIKASITVLDLAERLGLDPFPSHSGQSCDCPSCRNVGKADILHGEQGFKCRECGRTGDVIGFYMASKRVRFGAACEALEVLIADPQVKTAGSDLFAPPKRLDGIITTPYRDGDASDVYVGQAEAGKPKP